MNARTKVASFALSCVESWRNDDGLVRERKNVVAIEVLGRDAEHVAVTVRIGSWVTLEGYIRTEELKGQHAVKVRTLSITVWEEGHEPSSDAGGAKTPRCS